MNYSRKDVLAFARNPLHASLARWAKNPVSYDSLISRAEHCTREVYWHFRGNPMSTNAEALAHVNESIAKMKLVADELRMRIEEGNP